MSNMHVILYVWWRSQRLHSIESCTHVLVWSEKLCRYHRWLPWKLLAPEDQLKRNLLQQDFETNKTKLELNIKDSENKQYGPVFVGPFKILSLHSFYRANCKTDMVLLSETVTKHCFSPKLSGGFWTPHSFPLPQVLSSLSMHSYPAGAKLNAIWTDLQVLLFHRKIYIKNMNKETTAHNCQVAQTIVGVVFVSDLTLWTPHAWVLSYSLWKNLDNLYRL